MNPAPPVTRRIIVEPSAMCRRLPATEAKSRNRGFGGDVQEVPAIGTVFQRGGKALEIRPIDEATAIGDLLRAGDLQALPVLDGLDEIGRFEQRFRRAGVKPRCAAA